LEFKQQHQRRLNNLAVLEPHIETCFTTYLSIAPHARHDRCSTNNINAGWWNSVTLAPKQRPQHIYRTDKTNVLRKHEYVSVSNK
jgi:hypothetical protein